MKKPCFHIKNLVGIIVLGLIVIFSNAVSSQNTVITDDDLYSPSNSAMLDVKSTTKGLLIPRVTSAQRTAIVSPATGLLVYDTDENIFYYYKAGWTKIAIGTVSNAWTSAGNYVYLSDSTAKVGVGVLNPKGKMVVKGDNSMSDTLALFEVKDKNGETVFAVYPGGAMVYVKEGAKGNVNGFAVSGRNSSKAVHEYLRVTPDSVRIYIKEQSSKGNAGGFAVSGRNSSKGSSTGYFNVSVDSSGIVSPSKPLILWYPLKEAFLVGKVLIQHPDSVGTNSNAMGFEAKAKGNWSQAFGYKSIARGFYSTAIGKNTTANGPNSISIGDSSKANGSFSLALGSGNNANKPYSMALGSHSVANGDASFAMGYNAHAMGNNSIALQYNTQAMGDFSTAMGYFTVANGINSMALGVSTTANGPNSLAMGVNSSSGGANAVSIGSFNSASGPNSIALGTHANTNGKNGSFVFGDASTPIDVVSTIDNQFLVRAAGGLNFFTNSLGTLGVSIPSGGGAWVTVCDKNKKENFKYENPETYLHKLNELPIQSWNYKTQDDKIRHVSPNAQDLFAAFGFGDSDTTISDIDLIGMNMLATQALFRSHMDLQKEVLLLKQENALFKAALSNISDLQKENATMKAEILEMKKYLQISVSK